MSADMPQTSTAAAASTSAGSAPSAQDSTPSTSNKRKRVRVRRSRKSRTAATEEDDDDSEDDQGSGNADAKSGIPSEPEAAASVKQDPKSEAEEETLAKGKGQDAHEGEEGESDDDNDGEGDGGKKKRKRKRTRANKKGKKEEAEAKTAQAAVQAGDVGPDPELDLRLSEQGKKAIEYARIYSSDKSRWKFNKAKQNWLLRNALACPPADYDPDVSTRQQADQAERPTEGTTENETSGAKDEAGEGEDGENFIPDVFVPVVTVYLKSVMGAAKQRLIEALKEALDAPAPAVPTADGSATAASAGETDQPPATTVPPDAKAQAGTKSVSFGAMAMDAEKKDEAAAAAVADGESPVVDARTVELKRSRAKVMLHGIAEP